MVYFLSTTDEKQQGTARFALNLIYRHTAVQVVYTLVGVLIGYFVFGIVRMMSSGIWAVYFVNLTLRCMQNPDGFSR